MTYNLAKAPLMMCLKCPLCSNLVHEATTISECLHTFCRDCIYQELEDDENDCCPICNVNLGCSPLEKLRADRQLDDVCAKIFPVKQKKRKVIDDDVDHDSPAPAKRKERSLSSLGIGVPSSANPGFVKRKTKSVTRRSSIATSKDTSTDNDSEGKQSDAVKSGVDTEVEGSERACPQDTCSTGGITLEDTEKPHVLVKQEDPFDEGQEIIEAKLLRKLEQLGSSRKLSPSATKEQSAGHGSSIISKVQTKLVSESMKAASGGHKARGAGFPDEQKILSGTERDDTKDRKLPISFAVVRERTAKGVKRRSALAKLAEIAVDQAVKEIELPIFNVPRAPRGRGALETSKVPSAGQNSNQNLQEKAPVNEAAPVLHPRPPPPLFKSSSMTEKMPVVRQCSLHEKRPTNEASSSSSSKQKERQAGFWFVLQAADSQIGTGTLPQLSARYLRIKDGKLPISVVKKYLMKKLHLNNENEVEITCRGQPVVPNLPLESVRNIWFATMPSMKGNGMAESRCRRENHNCSEDYLMVLTYGRHCKPT